MTKGIVVIARNNTALNYVKQAAFLADQVKEHLGLPVSIITDSPRYIIDEGWEDKFDKIIPIVWRPEDFVEGETLFTDNESHNNRRYHDGAMYNTILQFKNHSRVNVYSATPYDETLLLDSDIFVMDDLYKFCFDQPNNFLIYDKSFDLAGFRNPKEFTYISNTGVKFYWATAVFFRKDPTVEIFFKLLEHIQENWLHYRSIFQIPTSLYRNDHAFSIAIHIMNGYQEGTFAMPMPGKLYFTTDRDILWAGNKDSLWFLLEKQDYVGEYTVARWPKRTIHVMNKFSLERYINEVFKHE